MGKTSKRFTKEYISDGKLQLSVVEEKKQASLVLTLKVNNYRKLKKSIFYYKYATFSEFSWSIELAKVKGTLFAILTTNVHDKTVHFSIDNIGSIKTIVHTAMEMIDTSRTKRWKSVYISEFCNKAIMNPENEFLPDDVLTVMCKYDIYHNVAIHLLFPLEQLNKGPDIKEPSDYFKNIYLKSICADFKILVNDSWFMVHKRVLSTRTGLFETLNEMYGDGMDKFHNASFDTFSHIMHRVLLYVYSGDLERVIPQCRKAICRIARKMSIPSLMKDDEEIFKSKRNKKKPLKERDGEFK